MFSNLKANLISPALYLDLANDCTLFRILSFQEDIFWTVSCSGTELPQCTGQHQTIYKWPSILAMTQKRYKSVSLDTFEI